MPVIVEDGSGVTDANSYVDLDDAKAYALLRGVILSADDAILMPQVINAADFIESFRSQFVGTPVSVTQAMSWPRNGVIYSDRTAFPNNAIPTQLVKAQNEAIIAVSQGIILQSNIDPAEGGFAVLEKVGPIETKFSEKVGTSITPFLPKVMNALADLLNAVPVLRTVRV